MAENEKAEKTEKNTYSAKNLEVLEGLDAVRMRPGMYIGSTGVKGLHHILWEIVDNAIDEAANGFANKIKVVLYKDGSASVEDNGRGIPTDIHPKEKVSGVQLVFTKLHAGGKFGQGNYQYSGGLHGVGASVTNALSEWLRVEVRHGTVYKMSFRSFYNARKKKYESGIPDGPLENTGVKTKQTGTTVRFKPDPAVFSETNFSLDTVEERLNELAFLNRGLEITLIDERITMADAKRMRGNLEADDDSADEENAAESGESAEEIAAEKEDKKAYTPHDLFDEADAATLEKEPYTVIFKYDGGISDFVRSLNEEKKKLYPTPVYYKTVKNDISVEFAVQHTTEYTESLFSFVNNIPTPEGGYHEAGFRSGIAKAFNDYARNNGFLKDKDANFQGDDFREGLTAVLSVKMREVQFEGQTK
ncbi:MAG TPA: DNA topoisomerase IV subunit B, partial [Clostridiales bacterium]|nr:DNA topoisomerase IV subunit B [Clostridiales bacterium]